MTRQKPASALRLRRIRGFDTSKMARYWRRKAQALRYYVFYERGMAPGQKAKANIVKRVLRRERDRTDILYDHLLVLDGRKLVGCYRLMPSSRALWQGIGFYSAQEYDLTKLTTSRAQLGGGMLELGRSCIHPDYRDGRVMRLLWQGLADYVAQHDITTLFGCVSMPGVEVDAWAEVMSYLQAHHAADKNMAPVAYSWHYTPMAQMPADALPDIKTLKEKMPPLLRGYLNLGAVFGDGAFVDKQFRTIDMMVIIPLEKVSRSALRSFDREGRVRANLVKLGLLSE